MFEVRHAGIEPRTTVNGLSTRFCAFLYVPFPLRPRKYIKVSNSLQLRKGNSMSDLKGKVKDGIDKAAGKTKEAAGKAVDKGKDAAKSAGKAMKKAGEKVKDAGKK